MATDGVNTPNLPTASAIDDFIGDRDSGTGPQTVRVAASNVATQMRTLIQFDSAIVAVKTKTLSTPPGSPTLGDRYIVKATGTGAWAGHDNAVATATATGWDFVAPTSGYRVFIIDEKTDYYWDAGTTKWTVIANTQLLFATVAEMAAVTGTPANYEANVVADIVGHTASRARSSNVATIVMQAAHGLTTGNKVNVRSLGGSGYNANQVTVTVTNSTTFTYANTGGNESTTADTAGQVDRNGAYASDGAGSWVWKSDNDLDGLTARIAVVEAEIAAAPTLVDLQAIENRMPRSNGFDNAAWSKTNVTITPITTKSPTGGTTVFQLTDDGTNNLHTIQQNTSAAGALASGTKVTLSAYALADTLSQIALWATNGSDDAKLAIFDLATLKSSTSSSALTAGMVPILDPPGWYRCWITITLDSTNYPALFVMSAKDGHVSYAGTGQSLYAAGAMVNEGDLLPYLETTTVALTGNAARESEHGAAAYAGTVADGARLDAIEESLIKIDTPSQIINIMLQSDDYIAAAWSQTQVQILPGQMPAPYGNVFASKLSELAVTNFHNIVQGFGSISAGTVISFPICAKAGERAQITGWFKAFNDAPQKVVFDLSAGTATPDGANPPLDVPHIIPIDGMPGWYRCILVGRTLTAGTYQIFWMVTNAGAQAYLGEVGKGLYVANAQAYYGSSIKPFAPTTTGAASAADTIYAGADSRPLNYISGTSTGVAVPDDPQILYICITDSQSNAHGGGTDALVATSPIYSGYALMGSNGPHCEGQRFTQLVDLIETGVNESAGSGWVNGMISLLLAQSPFLPKFAYFDPAIGGMTIQQLKRGGPSYDRFIGGLQDMCDAARRAGYRPVVLAVDWMGNESATYAPIGEWPNQITQMRRQMDEDIRRLTGQTENWLFFLSYVRTSTGYPFSNQVITGNRIAAMMDPNIRLAIPTYQFPSEASGATSVHMNNIGQNRRGQMLARAVFAEMFGAGWTEFRDARVYRSGSAEITVALQVPGGNIVMDTSGTVVPNTGYPSGSYYGFRFDDGSGAPPTITGHTIVGNFLKLALSAAPTGHAGQLAYATETVILDSNVAGCLRNDVSHTMLYSQPAQYDWCLPFITDVRL